MNLRMRMTGIGLAAVLLAGPGWGVPTIVHDPIQMAKKGEPMGVRATVRDAAARVDSATLFYAPSRGMTPFRVELSSSGAGMWYGTIPGHMIGPGTQLLYYIQAENADGETAETDWHTVTVVESGLAPEQIPSASAVAQEAQRRAASESKPPPAPPEVKPSRNRYLIPAAIIAGGAVAVGGAYAIAESDSGGGGGGSDVVTNANFGGTYSVCFEPTAVSNGLTNCDNGMANVYVRNGSVEVIGLWESEIFTSTLNGSVFSASQTVPATARFPESYLILSGEIRDTACTVTVNGYSRDAAEPGSYSGRLDATRR